MTCRRDRHYQKIDRPPAYETPRHSATSPATYPVPTVHDTLLCSFDT